jgi:hypothetical protein
VLPESEYGEAATGRICHSASGSKVGMATEVSENSVERISLELLKSLPLKRSEFVKRLEECILFFAI